MLIRSSDPDIEDAINATPIANGATQLRPAGRYRHSAINFGDDGGVLDEVLVFGGHDGTIARNDLWKLKKTSAPNQASVFEWSTFPADGGAPTARQGHAAIRDPVNNRMLVFGGANSSDQPIDFTLHALSLTGTPTWSTPTVVGDPPPPARHGHTFVLDPLTLNQLHHNAPTPVHRRRVLVFGGQESGGGLSSGLWILWIPEPGTGQNYQWQQVTPNVTTEGAPTGRYRLAADADKARFVIQGGDLGGGIATDETWGIDLIKLAWPGSETSTWDRLPPLPTKKLTGHTGLMKYLHWARHAERFSPATGNWETFANPKRQDSYPFHFVTPHTNPSRIFFAGPTEDSQYLVLASTPYWEPFPATSTPGYRSGSAVMFRPGEVMRCGSRDTDPTAGVTVGTTQRINLMSSPAPTAWTETPSMGIGRVNHNLVLLPTGGVLVTGGTSTINNQASAGPVFTPQIWSPGTSTWTPLTGSTALASDTMIRGYHSNAILLPDGRVLTGSGATGTNPQAGEDSHKATIFSPPYLYNSSGGLRPRLAITPTSDLTFGSQFKICVPSALPTSVVLIRPAASTHGFNQDQRYLPLSFQSQCNNSELLVTAPANGSIAPPGDYLIFANRGGYAPSIGQWIRLNSTPPADPPLSCPGCGESGFAAGIAGADGSAWKHENSLATNDADAMPLRLKSAPIEADGEYAIKLNQSGSAKTTVDQVELWSVDHEPAQEAFASETSNYVGTRIEAGSASTSEAGDVTPMANGHHGMSHQVEPEDALVVEIGTGLAAVSPFVVRARRSSRDLPEEGVDLLVHVETEVAPATWVKVGSFEPRVDFADATFDGCARRVRLSSATAFQVQGLGRIDLAEAPRIGRGPAYATMSGVRPVASQEAAAAAPGMSIDGESPLIARWPSTRIADGKARTFFLRAKSRTTLTGITPLDRPMAGEIGADHAYSLGSARPSPASGRTTISYSLARAGRVSIRIYDATGRLVRSLIDRDAEAGPNEAVWDGRNDHGRRIPGGVFFYRMEAGAWRSEKKVVVLAASAP